MKALSLRQPWAHAVVHLGKTIENRYWNTHLRGAFLIHAAKGCTQAEYDIACGFVRDFDPVLAAMIPPLEKLQKGGIIGIVEIKDCVTSHPSKFFCGPYGFVLARPYPLPFRPMIPKNSPFFTSKLTSSSALNSSYPWDRKALTKAPRIVVIFSCGMRKVLETFSTLMARSFCIMLVLA